MSTMSTMRSSVALIALVSLGGACTTTTTVRSFSDTAAQRWLSEHAASDMTVETNESPPGLADVRIEAISPTDIRFHATSGPAVPGDRIRRVTVRNHALGGLEGMLMGAGAGIAFGLFAGLLATTGSSSATANCEDICLGPLDTAVFAGVLFGVPALVAGLIGGAVKGHQEVLELK